MDLCSPDGVALGWRVAQVAGAHRDVGLDACSGRAHVCDPHHVVGALLEPFECPCDRRARR